MALRDDGAGEFPARIVLVAIGAGEIELALPASVDFRALTAEWRQARIIRWRDRLAARLQGYIGCEAQQLAAFAAKRRRLLPGGAAELDAAFEIDRLAAAHRDRPFAPRRALPTPRSALSALRPAVAPPA